MARDGRETITVAFDGDCLLCNRSLGFLAARDPHDRFRFVKLGSARGRRMRDALGTAPPDSVLVEAEGRVLCRSAAVLRLLRAMGGAWPVLGRLGNLLPRPLRDAAYDFIAARRHRWFGRADGSCPLPGPEVRARLLDGDGV